MKFLYPPSTMLKVRRAASCPNRRTFSMRWSAIPNTTGLRPCSSATRRWPRMRLEPLGRATAGGTKSCSRRQAMNGTPVVIWARLVSAERRQPIVAAAVARGSRLQGGSAGDRLADRGLRRPARSRRTKALEHVFTNFVSADAAKPDGQHRLGGKGRDGAGSAGEDARSRTVERRLCAFVVPPQEQKKIAADIHRKSTTR